MSPVFDVFLRFITLSALLCTGCNQETMPDNPGVAITIDDAPVTHMEQHASQWHRKLIVDSLTQALARYQAPAAIFPIGRYTQSAEGRELMSMWVESGVSVGNHTWSHAAMDSISTDSARMEIGRAQKAIRSVLGDSIEVTWFRFPFLGEGRTARERIRLENLLSEFGLQDAPVTMAPEDWKYELDYVEAEDAEDWERRFDIGQEYLAHVKSTIDFWSRQGEALEGRPINHVLLVHANRINRDYLGAILSYLKGHSFRFISLDEAYSDPIYDEEILHPSRKGTSFLDHLLSTRQFAERRDE